MHQTAKASRWGEEATLSPGRVSPPRRSLASCSGRAASASGRKSVSSPEMRTPNRGQRRPQSAPSTRVRRQRPATASGAPLALLLRDEELSRRTRNDPLLQAIEDAEVRRQKGHLRCQSFAYRDWVVDKTEKAPEDLQELREKHSHLNRARRPHSSPAAGRGRRQSLGKEGAQARREKKPQGWEALSCSQQLRSLGAVLETGQRRPNLKVSGPDGFSRLLEAVAYENGKSRVQADKEEREKAEADRLMTRLVQVLLLSANTLKAAFDRIDTMGRGRLGKKDFDAGLRSMGFDNATKDKKTIFRLLGFEPSEGQSSPRPARPVQLTFKDLEAKLSPFLAIVIASQQNAYRLQNGEGALLPQVDASVDVLQQFKSMFNQNKKLFQGTKTEGGEDQLEAGTVSTDPFLAALAAEGLA